LHRSVSITICRALSAVALTGALVGALVGLGSCHGDTLGTSSGTVYTDQLIDQQPHNDVDLLFVVDDTRAVGPKQEALLAGFPALVAALRAAPGGLPNLRVGVVSSNMGAFGSRLAECDHSDRGLLQGPVPGCAAAPQGRFLVSLDGGSRSNFAGDPADAFACLVRALGTEGCGFEQPLAAARRALDMDQPLENEGFLRPGALLGLVVVSGEDDCSAPATTDLFEPSLTRYGPQRSFRCSRYGHLCGGAPPPATATAQPLADCRSAEDGGKLTPVSEMAHFFQSLVAPERLLVSVIAGPPAPYAVQVVDGEAELAPSCRSATGTAVPAVRLEQFARSFGARGAFSSSCDANLSGALGRFGQSIVQQVGAACLTAAPLRLDPEGAGGGKADCWVTERAAGLGRDVPLPRCEATTTPRPCWSVVPSREHCDSSGYELRLDRGETGTLPGTVDLLRCRVCTSPGDPRCP
jgi:hypothetical protein